MEMGCGAGDRAQCLRAAESRLVCFLFGNNFRIDGNV